MREIVLDTETTGFDPLKGDRLVEIGCVEVMHGVPTEHYYHVYINPERDVPPQAAAVHGLTTQFLRDKPVFSELVGGFLDFIGDDPLIIHNAQFDMSFLNHEMGKLGFPVIAPHRVVDTLQIARERFPGSPASLDALCKRFEIDNSSRTLHGALLDAQLLAHVYVELTGGKQRALDLASDIQEVQRDESGMVQQSAYNRDARLIAVNDDQRTAHEALVAGLKDPLWLMQ
jgi:DNA polymerase III subunit epsilon